MKELLHNHSYSFPITSEFENSSSFLIPELLLPKFKTHLKEISMSRRKYLHFLLNQFRHLVLDKTAIRHRCRVKFQYQLRGQNLNRVSFCPRDKDWAELKNISHFMGMSMCKMFMILFLMDIGECSVEIEKGDQPNDLTFNLFNKTLVFVQKISHFPEKTKLQRNLNLKKLRI